MKILKLKEELTMDEQKKVKYITKELPQSEEQRDLYLSELLNDKTDGNRKVWLEIQIGLLNDNITLFKNYIEAKRLKYSK